MVSLIECVRSRNETESHIEPTADATRPRPSDAGDSDERALASRRHVLAAIGAVGVSASLSGFASSQAGSGPTIDSLELTDSSNPPWIWYYTHWDVSSEDGTLQTVRTELINDGEIVASDESDVSGSSASGEHRVRTRNEADTVRLIVVDEAGHLRGQTFEVEGANFDDGGDDDGSTTDDNTTADDNETDDNTTDGGSGPSAEGTPGPGMLATLGSIGGAGYLLSRLHDDEE